jgi:hypothetical protein
VHKVENPTHAQKLRIFSYREEASEEFGTAAFGMSTVKSVHNKSTATSPIALLQTTVSHIYATLEAPQRSKGRIILLSEFLKNGK